MFYLNSLCGLRSMHTIELKSNLMVLFLALSVKHDAADVEVNKLMYKGEWLDWVIIVESGVLDA